MPSAAPWALLLLLRRGHRTVPPTPIPSRLRLRLPAIRPAWPLRLPAFASSPPPQPHPFRLLASASASTPPRPLPASTSASASRSLLLLLLLATASPSRLRAWAAVARARPCHRAAARGRPRTRAELFRGRSRPLLWWWVSPAAAAARMDAGEMEDVRAAAAAEEVISSRGGSVLGKKTILKSDHFPGCQNKRLTPQIDGAPNYRQVRCFFFFASLRRRILLVLPCVVRLSRFRTLRLTVTSPPDGMGWYRGDAESVATLLLRAAGKLLQSPAPPAFPALAKRNDLLALSLPRACFPCGVWRRVCINCLIFRRGLFFVTPNRSQSV